MQIYNINYYTTLTKVNENIIISLTDFLQNIKNGTYSEIVNRLQQLPKNEYDAQKKFLPCITPSGTFIKRCASGIIEHSGIICIDIDNGKGENINLNATDLKLQLAKQPFIIAAFLSPSNVGLKVFISIDATQHLNSFLALQSWFKNTYNLIIDPSCKNVDRLCFVSYDPEIFINENATIFDITTVENNGKARAKGETTSTITATQKKSFIINDKTNEVELLIQKIETTSTDITGNYDQWLNIGFALASQFGTGGEDYFHRVSRFYSKYDYEACSNQYKKCCSSTGSGININTLFAIAKQHNILVHEPASTSKIKPQKTPAQVTATNRNEVVFYSPIFKMQDGTQVLTDLKINYVKFDELIYSLGYRRFDLDSDFSFIKIQNNVITQVQPHQIQDDFLRYINALPDTISGGIKREYLKTKIYKAPENYCSIKRLSLLQCGNFFFNVDTKTESFIYYKNGFVRCNKEGWELQPYKNLSGCIWQSQIVQRDFTKINFDNLSIAQMGVYAQFMFNVCNKNEDNFISLCSLTGYLLHSFSDVKLRAVILTDSGISEDANGRTGKTLFGNTLHHIKKLTQINGKDFDPQNKNKYQEANLDTQIIFLNDVRTNFKFENLYNDITEGITVEKKNKNPFKVRAKMCITTNKTISIEGGSSKDRAIEFEFSNHYSEKYSPENEFKHRFFSDWDKSEWFLFDNFMMYCICVYLGNGIVEPKNENLAARKLLDTTNRDFLEFMNDCINTNQIKANIEFDKVELHKLFISQYLEYEKDRYRGNAKTFYGWIKHFAKYDPRFLGNVEERKTNGKRFFILKSIN